MLKPTYALPFLFVFLFGGLLFWATPSEKKIKNGINNKDMRSFSDLKMKGHPVPAFHLKALETNTQLNQDLFTQSWSLLNVWASWCSSCKGEHDFLMALFKEKKIKIIGLNYRDQQNAAKAVLKETGNPYHEVIFDPKGQFALELGSTVTPETYLIDPQGIIQFRFRGPLNETVWQSYFVPLFPFHHPV